MKISILDDSGELLRSVTVVDENRGLAGANLDGLVAPPRVAANPSTNAKEWEWSLLDSAFGEHAATTAVAARA